MGGTANLLSFEDIMIHPEFEQRPDPIPHRHHECKNGHRWIAPVLKSVNTQNISGEAKRFCPTCESPSVESSEWVKADGSKYFRK
jgi:hypothetical protein